MSEDYAPLEYSTPGDRSDMLVTFREQFDKTEPMFKKLNSGTFISLAEAKEANHFRNDYRNNLETLSRTGFFKLDADIESVNELIKKYNELVLDPSKTEVKPVKIKPVEELTEESE